MIAILSGCSNGAGQIEEPEEPAPLEFSLTINDDWVWEKRPLLTVHVENPNDQPMTAEAKAVITTDKKEAVTTVTSSVEVPGNAGQDIVLSTGEDLAPGFYRASCSINGKAATLQMKNGKIGTFVFGISPEKIISAPDKQADFNDFWAAAKAQLAAVDMKAELTEITAYSSASRKVYLLEMQSVPDGPDGEPVEQEFEDEA